MAVEAAIFNKDFVSPVPGDNHASQVDASDVALQTLGVKDRLAVRALEIHPKRCQEIEIRMVAGHCKDEAVGDGQLALGRREDDGIQVYAGNGRVEVSCHLAILDAV